MRQIAGNTDVFVIGGGPAGLAAAIAARRKGFRVMLADQSAPGADKACGEGLMPEALAVLRRLGVDILITAGRTFRGIRFVNAGQEVDAAFPESYGLGVRRTALHQILAEHAAACGVELLWRTSIIGLTRQGVCLPQGDVASRWIIAADGGNSNVRDWAGLGPVVAPRRRFGFRRHFRIAPWTDRVEVHWGDDCQFYVAPIGPQEVCVALLSRSSRLRIADALPRFPALAARLASAAPVSQERGAACATLRLPRVYRGRVALVGDASGGVDAITGQGLFLAFSQALALADAFVAGDLAQYQTAHRRMVRRPAFMARLILVMDGRPRLRSRVMQIFTDEPRLFARMLAVHVGSATAVDYAVNGLRLGWRLVTA